MYKRQPETRRRSGTDHKWVWNDAPYESQYSGRRFLSLIHIFHSRSASPMGFLPSVPCFITVSAASAQTYWIVTILPVSYTHLDVYKRQFMDRPAMRNLPVNKGFTWTGSQTRPEEAWRGIRPLREYKGGPVSYTHLDVYKRQVNAQACWIVTSFL